MEIARDLANKEERCLCSKNLRKAGAQQELANTKMRFITRVKTHEIGLSLWLYIA